MALMPCAPQRPTVRAAAWLPSLLATLLLVACASSEGTGAPAPAPVIQTRRGDPISSLRGGVDTGAMVRSGSPSVQGGIDAVVVQKEVRARMGVLKACYERSLSHGPALGGDIVLAWRIRSDGTVEGVDARSDTVGSAELLDCLKAVVSRWRFPRPDPGEAQISFPFTFHKRAG
jgi:hypothetical protein